MKFVVTLHFYFSSELALELEIDPRLMRADKGMMGCAGFASATVLADMCQECGRFTNSTNWACMCAENLLEFPPTLFI